MGNKLISELEFKSQIQNARFFVVGGFRRSGTPQQLLRLIRDSYREKGSPSKITLMFSSTPTDPGVDILADENILERVIGSFYGSIPEIRKLVQENKVQGYSFPQGQVSLLFREIGRGSPGLISKVGLHTYVDPVLAGGKLNGITTEDLVKRINILGEKLLFYIAHQIDVSLLRGSVVDSLGNISMRDEPIKTEFLAMAQAAKSSGGKVFVQVLSELSEQLNPEEVDLPHHLVDGVILCKDGENDHRQTNKYRFNAKLITKDDHPGTLSKNNDGIHKQIIAQRTLRELNQATLVNLGQGLPEIVGGYTKNNPRQYKNILTLLESGVIGGVPERRPDFGAALGPSAFLTQDNQFVCFNGGQLDVAILSFAQIDQWGNVNVSRIGTEEFGGGGYMDIVHATRKLVFVGAFTAKKLKIRMDAGTLSIISEGSIQKFVPEVSQITYSSDCQKEKSQKITIITERCVFEVKNSRLILTEIASGIDLQKDILNQMGFKPELADNIIRMKWSIDGK